MKSSVSGLSLIIHLVIIGGASLVGLILGPARRRALARAVTPGDSFMGRAFSQALSIVIVFSLASIMLLATSVAITTGIREGANEPHRVYLAQQMQALKDANRTAWQSVEDATHMMLRGAASPTITYIR